MRLHFGLAVAVCLLSLCPAALAQTQPAKQFDLPALSRPDFNRLAVRANQPLFWVEDSNKNGLIDPEEVAVTGTDRSLGKYLKDKKFSQRFVDDYRALVEIKRHESLAQELNSGRPTLIYADLTKASAEDKALLKELLAAAKIVEELYWRQTGGYTLQKKIAKSDSLSQMVFWRNHGPWCAAPANQGNPFCNALASFPPKQTEAYPPELTHDDAMCKLLQKQPNADALLAPFVVVRKDGDKFKALPLTTVWGKEMKQVASHLKAAAAVIAKNPKEAALHKYLLAAAQGFTTNEWADADEAWVAMNSENSRWYLRVGPDEVYFDPCQQKAGFHLALALIDQKSIGWQKKLTPLRQEMEQAMANLIGAPYKARQVKFHMPDFIQVLYNAGDSRHPLGGVLGQSLPNWGKVVQEGRGRTVVMSNLYTDPDSRKTARLKAEALLSKASMEYYSDDPASTLLDVILHEATHNFGPYSDYQIASKPAKEVFGGKLASTLEELKAQTGALYYLQLLKQKKLIDDKELKQSYTSSIVWAFGHISRGMFDPQGNAQPYSQLAAIQVASFIEDGALAFKDGKFTIHHDKMPAAVEKLMKKVGQIKATGNAAAGHQLVDNYVKGKGASLVRQPYIAQQLLNYPKESFLYSISY